MMTRWCVDNHIIEVDPGRGRVEVSIDGCLIAQLEGRLLARYILPWRNRAVELRRTRNLDVARSELWINGQLCGPGGERARPAADGASCSACEGGQPAVNACVTCGVLLCQECTGLDGCRCSSCFERASREFERVASSQRRLMVGVGFALALGIVGLGVATGRSLMMQAGGGCLG